MNNAGRETQATRYAREFAAEWLGVFILTLVDAGIPIFNASASEPLGLFAKILAPGFVVMTMIFILGEISGAHINPSVTLAFAIRGVFPWRKVPFYFFFQFFGAFAAAALLFYICRLMPTNDIGRGVNELKGPTPVGFLLEFVMSWLLINVILVTACVSNIKGFEAAFPVGFTIICCGFIGKSLTGASMNPARSIGPAIFAQNFAHIWVYLLCPVLGAIMAVLTARFFIGAPKPKELKAAQGAK